MLSCYYFHSIPLPLITMLPMTDHKVVLRGKEAQMILESQVFKDVKRGLDELIVSQWKAASVRDKDAQNVFHLYAKIADMYHGLFVAAIEQGKFEERKLELDKLRDEPAARTFFRKTTGL
jgi:hypothetical protein